MTRPYRNKVCQFRANDSPTVCGVTATHEVKYEGPGDPVPVCPKHRVEAALDVTRSVSIRRLRLV